MSNEDIEAENATSEGSTQESGEVFAASSKEPEDEQLLGNLLHLLVWLRTLEERSLELLESSNQSELSDNEESPQSSFTDDMEGEEPDAETQNPTRDLLWTLENTVETAVQTRRLLLEVRQNTQEQKTLDALSVVRSRLLGLNDVLGVSFFNHSQAEESDDTQAAESQTTLVEEINNSGFETRIMGNWFISHLRNYILDFDRARCDLTVAMVEDDERESVADEDSYSSGSTGVLENGFHPSTTPPPQDWNGPLTGNMTELSRWVRPNSERSHRPIQNALRNQSELLWGRVQGGRLCEIYFESESRFTQCEERRKEELKENDS